MIIIDRFEQNLAVLEYRQTTFNLPRDLLPPSAKPGDVLNINITIDQKATEQRQNEIADLMQDVFES